MPGGQAGVKGGVGGSNPHKPNLYFDCSNTTHRLQVEIFFQRQHWKQPTQFMSPQLLNKVNKKR